MDQVSQASNILIHKNLFRRNDPKKNSIKIDASHAFDIISMNQLYSKIAMLDSTAWK